MNKPLWQPDSKTIANAQITEFARRAVGEHGLRFNTYPEFYRWTIERPEQFWYQVWKQGGVIGEPGGRVLVDAAAIPGARFFPDASLNFAENLLRRRDDALALIFHGEDRVRRELTHKALYGETSRLAQALRHAGVKAGDRVAAYLPNVPEAIMAMAAAASIGAVWSSCSPDFGVRGVLDRFGQIEPTVLFAVDGYFYGGAEHDVLPKVREIAAGLPSLRRLVIVPYLHPEVLVSGVPGALTLEQFVAPYRAGEIAFERLPFDHPLYILYSSGTTGVPKCIVHGAGGVLLKHLTEHRLHADLRSGDRLFYFTTLGWMMWNWLVTGLASGATLVLFDGNPFIKGGNVLFDLAQEAKVTHLGVSAKFIDEVRKRGLEPRRSHRLDSVRVILSTGSPLSAESFDYVYSKVKRDVLLGSVSGGTDICGCFVACNPILPVWRGEIQCRALGMATEVFDDAGRPISEGKGELVCTRPFPSMPIGFWNDPDGSRYKAAYFEHFPGTWRHGDWSEITAHGGMVIYGRSDAVLNPGGVRIGTAEIYRQVEQLDEVVESLVIGQDWPPGSLGDVRVVLFVKLRDGLMLDDALAAKIKRQIRANATPRHVPAKILQVPDIPRTKSNKIVELAVRELVHGRAVRNIDALANPEALEHFRGRPELTEA